MITGDLLAPERRALLAAERLEQPQLERQLRERASFAHHGFTRPEDLRDLAAAALVHARRTERGQ